jgi:hypothetical protein
MEQSLVFIWSNPCKLLLIKSKTFCRIYLLCLQQLSNQKVIRLQIQDNFLVEHVEVFYVFTYMYSGNNEIHFCFVLVYSIWFSDLLNKIIINIYFNWCSECTIINYWLIAGSIMHLISTLLSKAHQMLMWAIVILQKCEIAHLSRRWENLKLMWAFITGCSHEQYVSKVLASILTCKWGKSNVKLTFFSPNLHVKMLATSSREKLMLAAHEQMVSKFW